MFPVICFRSKLVGQFIFFKLKSPQVIIFICCPEKLAPTRLPTPLSAFCEFLEPSRRSPPWVSTAQVKLESLSHLMVLAVLCTVCQVNKLTLTFQKPNTEVRGCACSVIPD